MQYVGMPACGAGRRARTATRPRRRFVHGKFTPQRRVTTGADFASKILTLGEREVRLVIWDTAGQERFHHGTLGGAFYRGADAAL